jgi:hypothetical protein
VTVAAESVPTPTVTINLHEERPNAMPKPVAVQAPFVADPLVPRLAFNPFDKNVIPNPVARVAALDPNLSAPAADFVTLVQATGNVVQTTGSSSAPAAPKQPEPPPPGRAPSPDSPASAGGAAGAVASVFAGGVMAALALALFVLAAPGLSSRVATLFAIPLGVPRRLSLERPG